MSIMTVPRAADPAAAIAPTSPDELEIEYVKTLISGGYPAGDRAAALALAQVLPEALPAEALPRMIAQLVQLLLQAGGEAAVRGLVGTLQQPILAAAPAEGLANLLRPAFEGLVAGRNVAVLAGHCQRVVPSLADDFIAEVNARDGRRRVVFICEQINYKVLREALYLRQRGFRTYMIGLTPYPPEVEAAHDLAFDSRLSLPENPLILGTVVDRLAPEIYHLHCNMHRYLLGRVVIERKHQAVVVCEFNDIGAVYADRDAMCRQFPPAMVDLDLAMQGYILTHADAFVHQWSPAIEPVLRGMFGGLPPTIQFEPYPCAEFIHHDPDKLSHADGVIRFAYAGNPCPVSPNTPGTLFPGRYLPETVEALCAQGFAVDVFQDPSKFHWFHDPEGRYAATAARYPRFRRLKGVAPHELPRLIGRHDFGMMALKVDLDVCQVSDVKWRLDMANKFFAYLEAGLPLLVSAELEYMAEVVDEWGIGIAVAADELDRVAERVRAFDYAAAVANVQRFTAAFAMERQIDRLIALYDRVTPR